VLGYFRVLGLFGYVALVERCAGCYESPHLCPPDASVPLRADVGKVRHLMQQNAAPGRLVGVFKGNVELDEAALTLAQYVHL